MLEKATLKEIDNDVSVLSGNNKSQFPSKKTNIWDSFTFKIRKTYRGSEFSRVEMIIYSSV